MGLSALGGTAVLVTRAGVAAAAFVCLAATGAVALWCLRRPDRHTAGRHGQWVATLSLVTTWSAAVAGVALFTSATAAHEPRSDELQIALLLATNIGAFIALFRSTRTRSETAATLRELSALRVATLSAPIVEAGTRALGASPLEMVETLTYALRLCVAMPLVPSGVDRATLWIWSPERARWSVFASAGGRTQDLVFEQAPVGETGVHGAGVIANLAAGAPLPPHPATRWLPARSLFLCAAGLERHPWFRPNPGSDRVAQGIIVALLRRDGVVRGALTLTSREPNRIPLEGARLDELIDILDLWSQNFQLAVDRLLPLRESVATDHAKDLDDVQR